MLKTIFLSTSDRMIPLLEKLNTLTDIQLCVTKNDVKVGRKQEFETNKVKEWCIENNKEYLQIDNLKGDNIEKLLKEMTKIKPELCLVVDFNFIIPENIINEYKNRLVNIHYSLLPKFRGASPIQFAILNGENETGITYQFIGKDMDKGNILIQEKYNLEGTETSDTLLAKLLELNVKSLNTFIELFENGQLVSKIQDESAASYTYSPTQPRKTMIFKEDSYTKFDENSKLLYNKIRAFNPRPILWTRLKYLANYYNLQLKDNDKDELSVKLYEGNVQNDKFMISILQVEGKNKMSWNEFLNGYIK